MRKSLGYSVKGEDGNWHGIHASDYTLLRDGLQPTLVALLAYEDGDYVACWNMRAQSFVFLEKDEEQLKKTIKRVYGGESNEAFMVRVRVGTVFVLA